ncbi:anaphase-promoting complex subunit 8-like [Antedon mediterranea]|uniref:anaphase-promoting complex subunit 8-like n=1 Tax=Antedon mediterranea TaxID=105859 RepID=UPI003AF56DA3
MAAIPIPLAATTSVGDINLPQIKRELLTSIHQCSQRSLQQSVKWCAELCHSLAGVKPSAAPKPNDDTEDFLLEFDKYTLGKSYLDVKEYDRAAFFVKDCTSHKAYFIYAYAKYLAGEKQRYDELAGQMGPIEYKATKNETLKSLRIELCKKYNAGQLDSFCLYLYGVVLKKLELKKESMRVLAESIQRNPLYWGAWIELSSMVSSKEVLNSLTLPDHWMKQLFLSHIYLELQLNEESLKRYRALSEAGFGQSTYIMSQIAVAHHNLRDFESALKLFDNLQKIDPYRLENMDTYSNLLYVREMKAELAYLAHHVCEVDKYRVETCCVIGNYYSLRSQHEKAVLYFQRALKLNPHYLSAWTLMGHEFMEMKNSSAAIQAYRQAIEVNPRDFRAWYGLGQTYEILRMPFYCTYYYKQAQQLRPNDSRMLVALAESYENLEKIEEAKKCYWKAYSVGDVEGTAVLRLAKLLKQKLEDEEKAAYFYNKFLEQAESFGTAGSDEQCQAYMFLGRYYLKRQLYDQASIYAQKCSEYNEVREEGKEILREIEAQRKGATGGDNLNGSIVQGQNAALQDKQTPLGNRLSPMNLMFTP